ncbi:MAG: PBP1A family penicillin-binding protein [Croceibacterium sp.]
MAIQRGARSASRNKAPPPRPPVSGWKLWLHRILVWGGAIALLLALALGTAVYFAARNMPGYATLMNSQVGQTITVRANDGSELVALGPSYGQWLDADEIPQAMKDAMVAVEDRRFYSHIGVDPIGLARAAWISLRYGGGLRATSTITQQLARNIFLNSNRTLDRKLREAVLAMALEAKFSKAQILELYLNKVYFGGGAYGIDSASRKFFSHSARDLSIGEAAIIAGLVKAPSRYSPTADVDAAVSRANVVLQLMRRYGAIGAAEAGEIDISQVKLRPQEGQNAARYFTDWALPQLDILLSNDSTEPIEVWTTLDPGMEKAALASLRGNVPGAAQGALVSLDRDGAILAMVGGTDYVKTSYNRATEAIRQPGSAWKLFVYLSALEAGYKPSDRVVDEPVTIGGWSPRNSSGRFSGAVDLRTAFAYSINTVAAQLGNEVGFSTVASMARRFGITTPISTYPSMVLGTSDVRVLDMTRAFAAISAGGRAVEPYGITKVTSNSGQVLYRHQDAQSSPLVPDYVAKGMTDLLQTAVSTGTGRAAQIGRPVAGKTGTTSSNKDGWFLGFSSGITTGVWMGRDDAKTVPGLQGGTAPARAFATFMRYAVAKRPIEPFDTAVQLPEWQLEPDQEQILNSPDDPYYYTDEQGNLVEPGVSEDRRVPLPPEGQDEAPLQPSRRSDPRAPAPAPIGRPPPAAANDDFLDQATGRSVPPGGPAPRATLAPVPRQPPPFGQ